MSRIQEYLDKIKTAIYGRDVRDSIHDSIEECYSDVTSGKTLAETAAEKANAAAATAAAKGDLADEKALAASTAASSANTAATAANVAASNANEKAALANTAATNANTALTAVNGAKEDASNAAQAANTAADAANKAKEAADTAVKEANSAKDAANTAVSNANTAVTNANAAVTNANTAARNANEKANLANTAANNADEKATLADTAAGEAAAATASANTAKEAANTAAASANEKANQASAAASNAEIARNAANTAAANANAAAEKSNEAAESAEAAIADCNTATYNANVAAAGANTATSRANSASDALDEMTVTSESVGPDGLAEASITEVNGHKNIHFRLKQGQNGAPYIIKGNAYPTLDALETAITSPAIGDQYNVGSAPPYTIYRWTGTQWENQGAIGITIAGISNDEIDAVVNEEPIEQTTGKYLNLSGLIYFFASKLKATLNKKVDAVAGKGLSANDFTNAYKNTVDDLASSVTALRNTKVDKLTGKGLSTNDFTNAYKDQIGQNKTDIQALTDGKVNKAEGKGLSANDFTDIYKATVDELGTTVGTLSNTKVDKVAGKGLSTNDFTTAYKNQIDQNKTDIQTLTDDKVDKVEGKGLSTNDFTNAYKGQIDQNQTNIQTLTSYMVTMTGASASAAGAAGLVPAPAAGDEKKALLGDGTWGTIETDGRVLELTATALTAKTTADRAALYTAGVRLLKVLNGDTEVLLGLEADGSTKWQGSNKPLNNLLDNSDFTQTVNQDGAASYSGNWAKCVDRWQVVTTNEQSPADQLIWIDPLWINMNYYHELIQEIEWKKLAGKTITISVESSQGVRQTVGGISIPVEKDMSQMTVYGSVWGDNYILEAVGYTNNNAVTIRVRSAYNGWQGLKWAAVYEGSYVDETVPPYTPKGYATELAECRRYYKPSYTATLSASGWSSSAPYSQTVSAAGIAIADEPLVDVSLNGADTTQAGKARTEAWALVGRVTTGNGTLTAYCYEEKPTVDLPLILKVV